MDSELQEELDEGEKLSKRLVEHVLVGMGANGATIPVIYEDEKYNVSVTHEPA